MARDPKTKPTETDTSELPELTSKQMGFVQGLLSGLNASDAYRAAYRVENMSNEAIWVEASRLKSDPNVSLWLHRIRSDMLGDHKITLESHTRELIRLSKAAEASGNYGAAAKCVELTGRANGLYVDRIKTEDSTLEVAQVLERIAQSQPGVARLIAESMGLELPDSDKQDSAGQPVPAKPLSSLH